MATLDVAAKADLSKVLPNLVLITYFERRGILPGLTKTFHESASLDDGMAMKFTKKDGSTIAGNAFPKYLTELADESDPSATTRFLDRHFALRTYLAGYQISASDLAVWAALRANHIVLSLIRRAKSNVLRWYNYIETTNPWLAELTAPATLARAKSRAAASAAGASYDIDIPSIDGPMVTRFPPEPSGYLHIGHAKAALLNDYFAHQKPDGALICRFDDTNPSKESMEFQDSVIEDLALINIRPDKISHSSDYFQLMHDYAIQLIKDGKAFADDSELGKGDEDRKNRLPSKRRDLSIQETLARFEDMKTGSQEGLRWCIRARIAYDSPNGTLRDPVIYRCNLTPHHRTGMQWKVYPTYDFCAPILDSVEGVTLALRTNEYRDRNAQYEWIQEALGIRKVQIWDFSRMNFMRTVLSKRKLTRIVNEGKVTGWDDARMPTIRGILRRGMTVPAFREFILKQGPSRNVLNLEWGSFWSLNKKYIDPVSPRYTAIASKEAVRCIIADFKGPVTIVKPKHVKNPDLGNKELIMDHTIYLEQADALSFSQGEEITLMTWGNAFVRNIHWDVDRKTITALDLELNPGGDFKKTKKVTWLANTQNNLIPVDLVSYGDLITKDKLEKTDELEDFLAPVTEFRTEAFADCNVKDLPRGVIIQFERKGYYKLDVSYSEDGSRMIFIEIPTGKA